MSKIVIISVITGILAAASGIVFLSQEDWLDNLVDVVEDSGNAVISPTPLPTLEITPTVTPRPTPILTADNCSVGCIDCIHYPVNKTNTLRADYVPATAATNVNGGGTLVPEAVENLQAMFAEAQSLNLSPRIVSSYRSYQTQIGLFESYVQREMGRNNVDRKRAEEIANIYSAKAGHSEHQLGTTVDVSCNGCTPFANDASNQKIYEYLRLNAYKYGFVISYTEQNKHITNYKAEPWHIRYIGKDLATMYYSKYNELEGNYSLELFLEENCPV